MVSYLHVNSATCWGDAGIPQSASSARAADTTSADELDRPEPGGRETRWAELEYGDHDWGAFQPEQDASGLLAPDAGLVARTPVMI